MLCQSACPCITVYISHKHVSRGLHVIMERFFLEGWAFEALCRIMLFRLNLEFDFSFRIALILDYPDFGFDWCSKLLLHICTRAYT